MMRGERCMIIMERKDLKICRVVEEILLTHSQGIVVSSSMTRVFIKRFLVAGERCNVTGEYLKEAHILIKNSHKLLNVSQRIRHSKRRIL